MSAVKSLAVTGAAVLCLSLAGAGRAAAAEAAAPRAQAIPANAGTTPPAAHAGPTAVPSLAGLFADLSAGMSHLPLPQATDSAPDGSLMNGCEVLCCFEIPGVGIICCSQAEHVCWGM